MMQKKRKRLGSTSAASYRNFCSFFSALGFGRSDPCSLCDGLTGMGMSITAFAFMVVIIGGLGSIKGTMVSALIVGQVVSLGR